MKNIVRLIAIGVIIVLCLASAMLPIGRADTSQSVSLTANILPEVAIEVNKTIIDFGDLYPGAVSDSISLLINNSGYKKIWVTADVTDDGAVPLYVPGVKIDGNPWDAYNVTLLRDDSTTAVVSLDVPAGYSDMGIQNGTLIFWATAAE